MAPAAQSPWLLGLRSLGSRSCSVGLQRRSEQKALDNLCPVKLPKIPRAKKLVQRFKDMASGCLGIRAGGEKLDGQHGLRNFLIVGDQQLLGSLVSLLLGFRGS